MLKMAKTKFDALKLSLISKELGVPADELFS